MVDHLAPRPAASPRSAPLLVLCCLALATAPALAQAGGKAGPPREVPREAPLEVVESGFPEDLLHGVQEGAPGWIPYYVELRALRERSVTVDLVGTIEKQDAKGAEPVFTTRRRIEVHPGAPTRVWLYLRYPGKGELALNVRARAVAEGSTLALSGGQIHFYQDSPQERAIAMVVSGEHTRAMVSPWGESLDTPHGKISTRRMVRLEEKKLPDHRLGYEGVEVLVLRNFDELVMEPSQLEAIRRWVLLGGWVILVPSPGGEIFRTTLVRGLLPGARIGEPKAVPGFVPQDLWTEETGLNGSGRVDNRGPVHPHESFDFPEGISYTLVDPVSTRTRREIVSGLKGLGQPPAVRLYHEVESGEGRVGIMTFDDLTFGGEPSLPFRQRLWSEILGRDRPAGDNSRWRQAATQQARVIREKVLAGLSRDVGVWFIATLVIAYLIVVGPGIYFVLKRMNRLTSIIWVEPVVVVLYLGIIASSAYLTKGFLTKVRMVSVTYHSSGQPFLIRESHLGLFSAGEAAYRISAPGSDELQVLAGERGIDLEVDQKGPTLRGHRLAQWASETFAASVMREAPPDFGVEVKVEPDPSAPREPQAVTVHNRTGHKILEGFLTGWSGKVCATGEIAAGGRVRIERPFGVPGVAEVSRSAEPSLPPGIGPAGQRIFESLFLGPLAKILPYRTFLAVLEREEQDFVLDRPATLEERLDLFLEQLGELDGEE